MQNLRNKLRKEQSTSNDKTKQVPPKESSRLPTMSSNVSEWNRVDWIADVRSHTSTSPYIYTPILPFSNINYFTTQNIICSDMHLQQILSSPRSRISPRVPISSLDPSNPQIAQSIIKPNTKSQQFTISKQFSTLPSPKSQIVSPFLTPRIARSRGSTIQAMTIPKPPVQPVFSQLTATNVHKQEPQIQHQPKQEEAIRFVERQNLSDRKIQKAVKFQVDEEQSVKASVDTIPSQVSIRVRETVGSQKFQRNMSLYDLITSHEFQGQFSTTKKDQQNTILGRQIEYKRLASRPKLATNFPKSSKAQPSDQFEQSSQTFSRKMLQILNGMYGGFTRKADIKAQCEESKAQLDLVAPKFSKRSSKQNEPVRNSEYHVSLRVTNASGDWKSYSFVATNYRPAGRPLKKKPKTMLIDAINKTMRLNNTTDSKQNIFAIAGMAQQMQSQLRSASYLATEESEILPELLQYSFAKVRRFYKLYIQQRFFSLHFKIQKLISERNATIQPHLIHSEESGESVYGNPVEIDLKRNYQLTLQKYGDHEGFVRLEHIFDHSQDDDCISDDSATSGEQQENFQELLEDDVEFKQKLERMKDRVREKTRLNSLPSPRKPSASPSRLTSTQIASAQIIEQQLALFRKKRGGIPELKIQIFVPDLHIYVKHRGLQLAKGYHRVQITVVAAAIYVDNQRETVLKFIVSNVDGATRNWMLNEDQQVTPYSGPPVSIDSYEDEINDLITHPNCFRENYRQVIKRYEDILLGQYVDLLSFENKFEIENIIDAEKEALSNPKLRLLELKRRYRSDKNMLMKSIANSVDSQTEGRNISVFGQQQSTLSISKQSSSRQLMLRTQKSTRNLRNVQFENAGSPLLAKIPEKDKCTSPSHHSPRGIISMVQSVDTSHQNPIIQLEQQQIQEKPVQQFYYQSQVSMLKNSLLMRTALKEAQRRKIMSVTDQTFLLIKECRLNELEEFMMLNPNLPINTTDHAGNSFLIVASQCGFLEGVHLLLRKGANPNQTNVHINPLTKFDGDTALHRALAFNHYNVADCLVSNGAFSNIKNNKGLNPWAFTV